MVEEKEGGGKREELERGWGNKEGGKIYCLEDGVPASLNKRENKAY